MTRGGLPHSDIFGSKLVCSSPKLFAACHVLHRLLAPRHSPYTLSSLTIRNSKLTLTDRCIQSVCDSSMQHCFIRLRSCELRRDKLLWSEKTTVCRIFSCQRSACRDTRDNLVNVGSAGAPLSTALNSFPDVGVRETREPHLHTETLFQKSTRHREGRLARP